MDSILSAQVGSAPLCNLTYLKEATMNVSELLVTSLTRNAAMLKATIADFTDAELLTRPCADANHPAWQLSHLLLSEAQMISAASSAHKAIVPSKVATAGARENSASNDPSLFPTKAELLEAIDTVRAISIAWAQTLKDADLDTPGPEPMRAFLPTLGALSVILLEHTAMHIGQIQVARRKLGKPHIM